MAKVRSRTTAKAASIETSRSRDAWTDEEKIVAYTGDWNIGLIFRNLHRAGRDLLMERMGLYGVSVGAWYYLWALYQEDGLSQNELARRVRNVGPTAVSALTNMERSGLVIRVRSESDRRMVNVFLTAKSKKLRALLEIEVVNANERSLALLNDGEVEILIALLSRVRQSIE